MDQRSPLKHFLKVFENTSLRDSFQVIFFLKFFVQENKRNVSLSEVYIFGYKNSVFEDWSINEIKEKIDEEFSF